MNSDDEAPGIFYIFVNRLNTVTEHNFANVGSFASAAFTSLGLPGFAEKYLDGTARYLPYEPARREAMAVSPYSLSAINDYRIEYDAEVFREQRCRLLPSRLSATYAFGTMEACEAVHRRYGWPLESVKQFKLIEHPFNRVIRVNMELVSLARRAYRQSFLEEAEVAYLWEKYWTGGGNATLSVPAPGFKRALLESGIIWEYLIEGVVQHIDRGRGAPVHPKMF